MSIATLILAFTVSLPALANSQPKTVFPGADWQEASPESQGVDSAKLKDAVAYLDNNSGPDGAKELVIIRNGYLLWEVPNADAYNKIFSCTKVFTSTVLGLLVDDGKCSVNDLAIKHLPALEEQYPLYAKIKLRDLASMSGGYRGVVRDEGSDSPWGDPMGYLLPQSPRYEAGTACAYHDHDVFLLGHVLTRLAGRPLQEVFKRRIADPIGLTKWEWGVVGILDNGIAMNNAAGTPFRSQGIETTARELARLGHLYLNQGNWNGKQLLSASFVDQATSNQVPASSRHASGADPGGHYGFYWWTNGVMRSGQRPWPSAPVRTYTARGGSSNFCFVIPEWHTVVVRLASAVGPRGALDPAPSAVNDKAWNDFFARLGAALMDTPAAKGPAVASFTLINADTDQPLAGYDPLVDGATLDLAALPTTHLNIRANTEPERVGSVRFAYDGNAKYRTENSAPYALGGDTGGDYDPWAPGPGAHTLTATPYAKSDGAGQAGTPLSIKFLVPGRGMARPRQTSVSIVGDQWHINGQPTYAGRTWQGHRIEGLLFNSRMVQGTFDDLDPETRGRWVYPDIGTWDPERNTRGFVAAMPEWRRHGLLAFTLNLQGGSPGRSIRDWGKQPWHNSAFTEAGELRPDYMARLERILNRADELGMVVILGIFYFGQDQRLKDEAAVVRALDNTIDWVLDRDYRHILIEVNNECEAPYYGASCRTGRGRGFSVPRGEFVG